MRKLVQTGFRVFLSIGIIVLLVLLIVFLFPKERHYSEPPVLVINGMSYGVHENRFLDELPNGFTEAGVITEEMNSNNDNDYYIGCTYFCMPIVTDTIYLYQKTTNGWKYVRWERKS